jgi:hypothetical protein
MMARVREGTEGSDPVCNTPRANGGTGTGCARLGARAQLQTHAPATPF